MKQNKYFFVPFLFFLVSCATGFTSSEKIIPIMPDLTASQKDTWKLMVGKWYGAQPSDEGGKLEWIVDRNIQGIYQVRFRIQDKDNKIEEQTEVGEWGVAGGIYFSIFKGYRIGNQILPTDSTDPYNRNAYKIIELNDTSFIYQELTTGNKYTVRRVSEDFDFSPL